MLNLDCFGQVLNIILQLKTNYWLLFPIYNFIFWTIIFVKLSQILIKFMFTFHFLQKYESIDKIEILFSNILIMYINTKIISLPKLDSDDKMDFGVIS